MRERFNAQVSDRRTKSAITMDSSLDASMRCSVRQGTICKSFWNALCSFLALHLRGIRQPEINKTRLEWTGKWVSLLRSPHPHPYGVYHPQPMLVYYTWLPCPVRVWLCTLASVKGSIPSHAGYTWHKTGAHNCSLWGHGPLVKSSRLGTTRGEIEQRSWKQRSPGHHGMMGNSMGMWYSLGKGDKLGYWCQFPSRRSPAIVRSMVTPNPARVW